MNSCWGFSRKISWNLSTNCYWKSSKKSRRILSSNCLRNLRKNACTVYWSRSSISPLCLLSPFHLHHQSTKFQRIIAFRRAAGKILYNSMYFPLFITFLHSKCAIYCTLFKCVSRFEPRRVAAAALFPRFFSPAVFWTSINTQYSWRVPGSPVEARGSPATKY